MLDFFKRHFPDKTNTQDNAAIEAEEIKNMHLDETDVESSLSSPEVSSGLPEDFWPILFRLPFDFGSNEVPRIREGREYQENLLEYLKHPQKNKKDLTHYQTPQYRLFLQTYQQSQEPINKPTNTSIESREALLRDIKLS